MGLSASQARLLTITSRKSDCEFQSMRLSHEKIALSRNMTDISNEYQNSLNQTRLIYDFYGDNDKSVDVSYGLFMQPSEVNGYMPIITTDATGKVVLDSKYAAAARAAGIPTEGLGTLPSNVLRDRFLESLADTGIITSQAKDAYKAVPYAQTIGMGDIETIKEVTTSMNYEELVSHLQDIQVDLSVGANFKPLKEYYANSDGEAKFNGDEPWTDVTAESGVYAGLEKTQYVTIGDILKGEEQYTLMYKTSIPDMKDHGGDDFNRGHKELACKYDMQAYWYQSGNGGYELLNYVKSILGTSNSAAQTALNYADMMIAKVLKLDENVGTSWNGDNESDYTVGGIAGKDDKWFSGGSGGRSDGRVYMSKSNIIYNTDNYIGYYMRTNRFNNCKNSQQASVSIDIGNILKAYLTYFANAMDNFSGKYYVDDKKDDVTILGHHGCMSQNDSATVKSSKLVGNKINGEVLDYNFNVIVEQTCNTSDALMSSFYDALFNQICMRGWVENNNVTDKNYLQDMYKNGMMFVTATSDDGYYYQENYGSFSYIKEVADDEAIARAEAKYNTEKAKLNHKEEVLDLKMKNLDTEISSLTTEYDTIKSLISKNIERGFKRYDA